MEEILTVLNKIMPVVARVHGDHHPELKEVLDLYNAWKEAEDKTPIAAKLQEITSDFAVPADACPTYEKAYTLLKELTQN